MAEQLNKVSTSFEDKYQKPISRPSYLEKFTSFFWSSRPQQQPTAPQEDPLETWEFVVEERTDEKLNESLKELAVFFNDALSISTSDIDSLVTQINTYFPEYAIDPNQNVISQICAAKEKLVAAGEEKYLKKIIDKLGIYSLFLPRYGSIEMRETLQKINEYRQDRSLMTRDISYQRNMLLQHTFSQLNC